MTEITEETIEVIIKRDSDFIKDLLVEVDELHKEIAKLKGRIAANDWTVETAYKMAETKAFNEGIEAAEKVVWEASGRSVGFCVAAIRALKRGTK